MIHNYN